MNRPASSPLCLQCGLCCDGTIFADVALQPEDNIARLWSLGLPLVTRQKGRVKSQKFPQPCVLLDGCACRSYDERPKHCRDFECLLLKAVAAGRTDRAAALGLIRQARQRADTVRSLLRELGDGHDQVALGARFRRLKQRLETNETDAETAEIFGRLTLAMHDLNLLLSESFYSGPAD